MTSRQSLVPKTLRSQWRYVRHLKSGGQSRPILLKNVVDGRFAVVKLLNQSYDPEGRARLTREIAILESIKNESTVELLAYDLAADPPWYLTPFGEPLDDYWKKRRIELSAADLFDESRQVVLALLGGLAQFHAKGGVHRDIKPANVIILRSDRSVRPVLIDFGIAFIPDDNRITPTDGRIVANRFAAPPDAFYGRLDKPPQWWDLLGIAWLWGWMLMEGHEPKYGRYDARYHRFIHDPRCERVRSLWMAVSVEAISPQNADEMLRLLPSIGLGAPQQGPQAAKFDFRHAIEAVQDSQARQLRKQAEFQRILSAAAARLALVYDELLNTVRMECDLATSQGLPIIYSETQPPLDTFMSLAPHKSGRLMLLELGEGPDKKVEVEIGVTYAPSRRPGFLPIQFWLTASKGYSKFYFLVYYHALDGRIGVVGAGEDHDYPESDEEAGFIEEEVLGLIRAPALWSWTVVE